MASERESVAEQNEERGANIGVVEKREEEEKREGGERQGREDNSYTPRRKRKWRGKREREKGWGTRN